LLSAEEGDMKVNDSLIVNENEHAKPIVCLFGTEAMLSENYVYSSSSDPLPPP
jgi:hypothetical protein